MFAKTQTYRDLKGSSKNSNFVWNRDLFYEQLCWQLISIQQSIQTICRLVLTKNFSDPHRNAVPLPRRSDTIFRSVVKGFPVALLLVLSSGWLGFTTNLRAQEITRVAVLDYSAVMKTSVQQSQEMQRIKDLKAEVGQEMERLKEYLQQLQQDYNTAQGDNSRRRRIQNEINKQRDYGRKYLESKNKEITFLQKRASQSVRNEDLQRYLPDIINQVAREQGYSLILDKNSQSIVWLDTSIDITETIIQRLRKRLGNS